MKTILFHIITGDGDFWNIDSYIILTDAEVAISLFTHLL